MDIERLPTLLAGLGIGFAATCVDDHIHIVVQADLVSALQQKMGSVSHSGYRMQLLKGGRLEFVSLDRAHEWDSHCPYLWPLSISDESVFAHQLLYYYMRSLEATAPEPEPEVDYTRIQVVNNTYQHKRPGSKRREREQRKLAYQTKGARQ